MTGCPTKNHRLVFPWLFILSLEQPSTTEPNITLTSYSITTIIKLLRCLQRRLLYNRQFQLLVYACRGRWEVRYHISDYAEKIKMVAV
jgi:hypothetical protein